ncbi:MAG: SDR family oxidoreductase [Bacteroidia bacterium]|nr:SDR family oxidoreductase [Bacteroidia bacterium]
MAHFQSKVIWITGASSGIGEALAKAYSKSGYSLIISSRREEKLEQVRELCPHPDRVKVLPLDLEMYEGFGKIVQQAMELYGYIDMLINNAGISQRSLIRDTDMHVYKRLMDVNYLGTVALTKAVLPHFIERKSGHFVTVTSLMGKFGSPLRSGYCGAKHALHGFFDVLRMEHEKDGIAVSLICPGFVQTQVARNALTNDGTPQSRNDEATSKGLSPEEFASRMIRAVNKNKFEAYIGGKEIKGIYLKRFFPKLLHKVVLRSDVV